MKRLFAALLAAVALVCCGCGNQTADLVKNSGAQCAAAERGRISIPEPEEALEPTVMPDGTPSGTVRSILTDAAQLLPQDGTWAVGGNLVYYGSYNGTPLAYRVLAMPQTQTLTGGGRSLLLDCDTVLDLMPFDDNFARNEGQIKVPSEWKGSDIELWMNGSGFFRNKGIFSPVERSAVAKTVLHNVLEPYAAGTWTYRDYGSVDYVFSLSAAEADALYAADADRAKDGCSICWWLRSMFGETGNGAGSVHGDGHLCNNSISFFMVGVSPAFHVDLDAVLLATAIGQDKTLDPGETGAAVAEIPANLWKLTLLDESLEVSLTGENAVVRTGNTVSVSCECHAEGATQISVMITDGSTSFKDANVLFYGALQQAQPGVGTFTLPEALSEDTWGTDYRVYLLADDVNGTYQTDYAGFPLEITAYGE